MHFDEKQRVLWLFPEQSVGGKKRKGKGRKGLGDQWGGGERLEELKTLLDGCSLSDLTV